MASKAEIDKVVEAIEALGDAEGESLDGLVHDAFDSQASAVNNEGLRAQVEFLLDEGYTAKRIINEAKGEIGG